MPSITLVLYSQHMASASQSYDVGIIVPGLQMGWSSEKWRYLPGVTQPVPQELALECRAAWHCSDQGTFISWPSHAGPWLRKLNSEPKQERCLPAYRSLSGPPLQGCFRDSSASAGFICEAGGMPCRTPKHIFVTLRNQGNIYTWQR